MKATLKVNPRRLPEPPLPPTKPVRIDSAPDRFLLTYEDAARFRDKLSRGGQNSKKDKDQERPEKTKKDQKELRNPRCYTEEEVRIIKDMYRSGHSIAEISEATGRTQVGIEGKVRSLFLNDIRRTGNAGIPQRKWTPEEDAEVMRMYKEGVTAEEIGKVLDRSRRAVHGRIFKLKKEGRIWSSEE